MQQQQTSDELGLYNCQICKNKAHKPVLTYCGHLFCWSCYYRTAQEVCPLCGGISEKTDIYPLFIEQELSEPDESALPSRPLPVNRPKIPNSDIISNRSVYDKNNVAMGRQFAGTVLLTPLAMAAYSQMGEAEENDAEKRASVKMKWLFLAVTVLLVVLLGLYLLLSA